MTQDEELDLLFTSGAVLSDGISTAPCDYSFQDVPHEVDKDQAPVLLPVRSALVRAWAFPYLVDGTAVVLTDEDGNDTALLLAGPPRRVQDGKIFELNFRVRRTA